jgi:hypothetical protein
VCVPKSFGDPVMAAPARSGFEASQLPKDAASQTLVRQPSAHAALRSRANPLVMPRLR